MVTAVKKLIHQSPINEIKTVTKRFLFLKSKFPDFGLCNRRAMALPKGNQQPDPKPLPLLKPLQKTPEQKNTMR